jgi:hypothetical protein
VKASPTIVRTSRVNVRRAKHSTRPRILTGCQRRPSQVQQGGSLLGEVSRIRLVCVGSMTNICGQRSHPNASVSAMGCKRPRRKQGQGYSWGWSSSLGVKARRGQCRSEQRLEVRRYTFGVSGKLAKLSIYRVSIAPIVLNSRSSQGAVSDRTPHNSTS